MSAIAENFTSSTPILERVCRCWRYMVLSYRTAILPLLPTLAQQLASGFQNSRQGCFLWATDSVLQLFRATSARFSTDYERPSTEQSTRCNRRFLPPLDRRPNLLPHVTPTSSHMLTHPGSCNQHTNTTARSSTDSNSSLSVRLFELRH